MKRRRGPCRVRGDWTAKTLDDVVIIPFNDAAAARRIIARHGDDLAAVIVEPVMAGIGYVPAEAAFLEALREACDGQRILLIFDEVQTLRMAPGGAQQWYDVLPDMSCLGKIVGGGMPVGAFGGRADIMAAFDATEGAPDIPHGGTFNGNPMTMQAGLATMRQLTPEVYEQINERGETLRHQLEEMARQRRRAYPHQRHRVILRCAVDGPARDDLPQCPGTGRGVAPEALSAFVERGIYVNSRLVWQHLNAHGPR